MTVGVHMCRGNLKGTWMAEGGYEPIAERLFNEAEVDAFFLEFDTPRAGDFTPLRHVPKSKSVVLGLVSSKTPVIESKDDIKRRIDEAARYVDLDRLALSPQCGFSSGGGSGQTVGSMTSAASSSWCSTSHTTYGAATKKKPKGETMDLRWPASRAEIARIQSERRRIAFERSKRAPFYKGRLDHINVDRLDDPEVWAKIPLLTKEELRQIAPKDFASQFCIQPQAAVVEYWRSGGSGRCSIRARPRTWSTADDLDAHLVSARHSSGGASLCARPKQCGMGTVWCGAGTNTASNAAAAIDEPSRRSGRGWRATACTSRKPRDSITPRAREEDHRRRRAAVTGQAAEARAHVGRAGVRPVRHDRRRADRLRRRQAHRLAPVVRPVLLRGGRRGDRRAGQ
jgi:hypothetical protein